MSSTRQLNSTKNPFFNSRKSKLREFIAPTPPLKIFQSWGPLHSSLSQLCNQKLQLVQRVMVHRTISQSLTKQATDEKKTFTPSSVWSSPFIILSLLIILPPFLTDSLPRSALTLQQCNDTVITQKGKFKKRESFIVKHISINTGYIIFPFYPRHTFSVAITHLKFKTFKFYINVYLFKIYLNKNTIKMSTPEKKKSYINLTLKNKSKHFP